MIRKALVLALAFWSGAQAQSPAVWSNMRYRMIGPERGGRVTAVTGVPSQPYTFYMGSTGGGVWKTTDAGHSWVNISDGQIPVGSMGAIEVSLSDPNVIYAGTGSSKIRSNVSIGRGMYKSTDARQDVDVRGPARRGPDLDDSREPDQSRHRVRGGAGQSVHAKAKSAAYIAPPTAARPGRRCCSVSDTCGAADLELQPGNPERDLRVDVARAAQAVDDHQRRARGRHLQEHRWRRHVDQAGGGLPNELFGRGNVAISAAMPNRIYALIEAKPGSGLYRSDDAGVDVGAGERIGQSHHAAVLLRHARSGSEQRRRRLGRQRRLVQEHRRRQDLPQRRRCRTATITTCGSIRRTRST